MCKISKKTLKKQLSVKPVKKNFFFALNTKETETNKLYSFGIRVLCGKPIVTKSDECNSQKLRLYDEIKILSFLVYL